MGVRVLNSELTTRMPMRIARVLAGRRIMDLGKMLAELRQERQAIEEAILTLERLSQGRGKRRGRPPAWMVELRKKQEKTEKPAAPAKKRGRPPKQAQSES